MSAAPSPPETKNGLQTLLEDPWFELMAFDGFRDQIESLPDGAQISVTASPELGIDATIEKTTVAAERGYTASPHLAARYVRSTTHLEDIVGRLREAGVTNVFVPAGDLNSPDGPYESADNLLMALDEMDQPFEDIGITGYPEGHPFLDADTLAEAMSLKIPHATYIVTQLCFDPGHILDWIRHLRDERDVHLGVAVGVPGVLKYQRLLRIAHKVGVGNSIRFLRKTTGLLEFGRRLFGSWSTKYTPDDLVDGLAPHAHDPTLNLRGLHLYTFNQVDDTEEWRQDRLQSQ